MADGGDTGGIAAAKLRSFVERIERLETTAPYVSMPGEAGTIPSCALVLKVLR